MARIIGYARVSTAEQTADGQVEALRAAGADPIFVEKVSGRTPTEQRKQLGAAIAAAEPGDTLLVWRCDRMARSLSDLIGRIKALGEAGVQFRSLTEPHIDTTTPTGTLMLSLVGAFAQFEADLIAERTRAGLAAAKARGRTPGRPRKVTPQRAEIAQRWRAQGMNVPAIAKELAVSERTVSRLLAMPLPHDEPATDVDAHASTHNRVTGGPGVGWPT